MTTGVEILASVYFELGRRGVVVKPEPAPQPRPEPVVARDGDGGGFLDRPIAARPSPRTSTASITSTAAAVLMEHPDTRIEIKGHTDDQALRRGSPFADDDALSQARADAVKRYLVEAGLVDSRRTAKGLASTQPLVKPVGPDGEALDRHAARAARTKNRRVEFHILDSAATPAP